MSRRSVEVKSRGGLAASARTEQSENLSARYRQVDPVEDVALVKVHLHAMELHGRGQARTCLRRGIYRHQCGAGTHYRAAQRHLYTSKSRSKNDL
jgi:hypothetical protein